MAILHLVPPDLLSRPKRAGYQAVRTFYFGAEQVDECQALQLSTAAAKLLIDHSG